MTYIAGVDGTPGGWAVVIMNLKQLIVRKVLSLSDLFDDRSDLKIVAVDVPIGLLERYERGGRACDRAARKLRGRHRDSSVLRSASPVCWIICHSYRRTGYRHLAFH
jgi:predicted RNase H-like nuclease